MKQKSSTAQLSYGYNRFGAEGGLINYRSLTNLRNLLEVARRGEASNSHIKKGLTFGQFINH